VGVFYSTVIRHVMDLLGMKNFHLRRVPFDLTPDLHRRRLEICERLVSILKVREPDSFRMLVTGDESWFVWEYEHSTKWGVARDEVPKRVSQTIGTKKIMLTVIWRIDGFHVVDMIPPGAFQHRVLPYSYDRPFASESLSGRKEKPCTSTECSPGQLSGLFSKCVKTVCWWNFSHYCSSSPDNFWLFCHIKTSLAGRIVNDVAELPNAIIEFLNEIQPSELQLVFHDWMERVKWVSANNGDYYHE
jgi:hypothetical protein